MAKFKILTAALAVLLAGCAQNAPVQQEQPEEEKVIIEIGKSVFWQQEIISSMA